MGLDNGTAFIDISKQKEIEVALRESEELFRKLVMTVPDLIVRTNLNGDIIFVNEITYALAENLCVRTQSQETHCSILAN